MILHCRFLIKASNLFGAQGCSYFLPVAWNIFISVIWTRIIYECIWNTCHRVLLLSTLFHSILYNLKQRGLISWIYTLTRDASYRTLPIYTHVWSCELEYYIGGDSLDWRDTYYIIYSLYSYGTFLFPNTQNMIDYLSRAESISHRVAKPHPCGSSSLKRPMFEPISFALLKSVISTQRSFITNMYI